MNAEDARSPSLTHRETASGITRTAPGPGTVRAMIDDGNAVHYSAVERGTPVFASDGVEVGRVDADLES